MTTETSNARGDLLRPKLENIISGHRINADDADWLRGLLAAAPPPAAARGDVRGLGSLAKRVQYANTHAQVSEDDAGEFVCLPPWLWLEIRDAAAEALAAEGVQAGEVEQRARELLAALRLAMEWNWLDDDARPSRVAEICDAAIAKATSQDAALTGERNG